MKILLTAFACDPTRGSDAGVGWRWAEMLAAQGHEIWVLTRTSYKDHIEKELVRLGLAGKLHFVYYDHEHIANLMHRMIGKLHLYYYIWQLGAYYLAKKIHKNEDFDLVHHVTWVSARLPSFMGNLNIPFIFGPIAGGESAPMQLRSGYGVRTWIGEIMRDISNLLVKFDPMMRSTFNQATQIYVTSVQTGAMVPKSFRSKTRIQLAIAAEEYATTDDYTNGNCSVPENPETPLRILYVGRFLEWKGMHLGLPAFANLLQKQPNARLTLVGTGPAEQRWRKIAENLGISGNIDWISWIERSKLPDIYRSHDVFLFPSLHDSGGMVILEAMSHGLPVVCLDIGGPGVLVNSSCGFTTTTRSQSKNEVINSLSNSLILLTDQDIRRNLHQGARARVKQFTWAKLVSQVYDEQCINKILLSTRVL